MTTVTELSTRIDELTREVGRLRACLPSNPVAPRAPAGRPLMSRRAAFVAAAGGIGAAVATVASAGAASAKAGDTLRIGFDNYSEAMTSLITPGGRLQAVLNVLNPGTGAAGLDTLASYARLGEPSEALSAGAAVTGDSFGRRGVQGLSRDADGVHGLSTHAAGVFGSSFHGVGVNAFSQNGSGITAKSTAGVGISAQGGRAPLRLVPGAVTGAPTAGAHAIGELWCDSAGALYTCTAAGTPGTWKKVTVS